MWIKAFIDLGGQGLGQVWLKEVVPVTVIEKRLTEMVKAAG